MTIAHVDTPVGRLSLVGGPAGLQRILWEGEDLPGEATRETGGGEGAEILRRAVTQITEYFAGQRTAFDLPLDLAGTAFQQKAWLALATIPYGTTISYAEQARRVGHPRAVRAVGSANGRNPVPIVLPCHRVVTSGGSLGGFGGGLDVKRALLDHEARTGKD